MSLYSEMGERLAPYDLTVEAYIAEMRAEGVGWSDIMRLMRADDLVPFRWFLTSETVARWAKRGHIA